MILHGQLIQVYTGSQNVHIHATIFTKQLFDSYIHMIYLNCYFVSKRLGGATVEDFSITLAIASVMVLCYFIVNALVKKPS